MPIDAESMLCLLQINQKQKCKEMQNQKQSFTSVRARCFAASSNPPSQPNQESCNLKVSVDEYIISIL